MKITDIKPNEKNPRKISSEKLGKLKNSIKEFEKMMKYRPIVVDKDMTILGGNMRYRALEELGYTEINDDWVKVADDLSEDERERFIIEDNVGFGEWDWEILEADWDKDDLEKWGLDLPATFAEAEVIEDEPPEVSDEEPKSRLGEIYKLGRHRVMCGDSTKIEDVEKLMDGAKADMVFTDPPYGVSYEKKNEEIFGQKGRRIMNDELGKDALEQIVYPAFCNIKESLKSGGVYYVCSPQGGELGLMMMMMMMMNAGIECRHMIVWKKDAPVFSMGRLDYDYQHEPILYGWVGSHKHIGAGQFKTSVWDIPRPKSSKLHPTMKPIELVANAIQNSSKGDDIILDLFLGSGSTMIASEQTGRICYGMELDPKYTDVIRKRYAKFIGKEEQWEEITPAIK